MNFDTFVFGEKSIADRAPEICVRVFDTAPDLDQILVAMRIQDNDQIVLPWTTDRLHRFGNLTDRIGFRYLEMSC